MPSLGWILLLLLLSRFSRVRLCATPKMAAHQAPSNLGFSRQEQWSGLPFPSPVQESEKWKWSHSVVDLVLRNWCPYRKGKFGLRDRYAQREDDMKRHREDNMKMVICMPRPGTKFSFTDCRRTRFCWCLGLGLLAFGLWEDRCVI